MDLGRSHRKKQAAKKKLRIRATTFNFAEESGAPDLAGTLWLPTGARCPVFSTTALQDLELWLRRPPHLPFPVPLPGGLRFLGFGRCCALDSCEPPSLIGCSQSSLGLIPCGWDEGGCSDYEFGFAVFFSFFWKTHRSNDGNPYRQRNTAVVSSPLTHSGLRKKPR